jgi:hypothetical protein
MEKDDSASMTRYTPPRFIARVFLLAWSSAFGEQFQCYLSTTADLNDLALFLSPTVMLMPADSRRYIAGSCAS